MGSTESSENLKYLDQHVRVISIVEDPFSEQNEEFERGHFGVVPAVSSIDVGLKTINEATLDNPHTLALVLNGTALFAVDTSKNMVTTEKEVFMRDVNGNVTGSLHVHEFVPTEFFSGPVEGETIYSDKSVLTEHKENWNLVNNDQEWSVNSEAQEEGEKIFLGADFVLTPPHQQFLEQFDAPEIGLLEIISQNAITVIEKTVAPMLSGVRIHYPSGKAAAAQLFEGEEPLQVRIEADKTKRKISYTIVIEKKGEVGIVFEAAGTLMKQVLIKRLLKKMKHDVTSCVDGE